MNNLPKVVTQLCPGGNYQYGSHLSAGASCRNDATENTSPASEVCRDTGSTM